MAEKSPVHSDHLHCASCAKLKEESCAEIKKSLQECSQAHEDARIEKEQAVHKELKEAKNKINKLQKTLSAFQLATTVGVTILGQEAFDKIFGKVEEVQKVQAKITEIAPPIKDKEEKSASTKEPKKTTRNTQKTNGKTDIASLLDQFTSLDKISEAKIQITKSETQSGPWVPTETVAASTKTTPELIVDPPVVPPITVASTTNYDFPIIFMSVPDMVLPTQYSLLGFQDSPFVFGQGYDVSAVPAPNTLSVFALSLINTPRRRMA
jgi:hypothetical protein